MAVPLLVVLDLDMCCWDPEMFQLHGAPSKWNPADNSVQAGRDKIKMFPGALAALRDVHNNPLFSHTKLAVASSTTEPEYARACMSMFEVSKGVKMSEVVSYSQIFCSNKANHFANLKKDSKIEYADMLFFDDCNWGDNCADVERGCPGVVTMKTPSGMQEKEWQAGLAKFAAAKAKQS
mmetsp:Transcript_19538/g.38001  ORF Transcript_19538/g.38001 Transcript_19538/m.38001 type:complete len:179 (+) Transcript_19538:121-657(+)|eukprot:CAMPEP_0173378026 /NCGR_PEP_ID=MMETSP1356-20130122/1255_1 /TAXON_ID=77927 ORGANISM="Hemiselmis virescens, Strain PCC157" /NCGR_SAMPLE_ID=MMETSP1356 /ASSEMBLY_ACC=CAM_ASM_000847 /LENGTH=178 /DNA_ID=CAMNT_0014330971 /DNA_START=121 /DNA_END=657 /DNA_ORIENTATION=+